MMGIFRAYIRAFHSLFLPGMLAHFLWPLFVSMALWIGLGVAFWGKLARALMGFLRRFPSLAGRLPSGGGAEQAVSGTFHVSLYLLSLPLIIVTMTLLLESVALPFILEKVAKADYANLERRQGGSQWQSLRNTLVSFLIAAAVAIPSLPLWLLPGVGLVLSVGFSAWLNYRSFRYDVLVNHADRDEIVSVPQAHQGRLILLSVGGAMLTLIPLINLLAVPFTALAFTHYLLRVLQQGRETKSPLKR
jgi:uncharacterized protein involved in cysteine biosynthesis